MIRKATLNDLPEIMRIYDVARAYMRENGNPTQWQVGYPYDDLVRDDISDGNMYVIETDSGKAAACFGIFEGDDPTYAKIEGEWGDGTPYAAIHRVASDGSVKGVFRRAFEFTSERYSHIRIDTHKNNLTMQKAIMACGFVYRGMIYVEDGSPRMAYEWSRQ